jgi:hypothetical protein
MDQLQYSINEKSLILALDNVRRLYAGDADLIRLYANKHQIDVIEGNLLSPFKELAFNPHIPAASDEEIAAIKLATNFAVICDDYRQSAQVVLQLNNPEVVLSVAGGPVQPEANRKSTMTNLLAQSYKTNPNIKFTCVFHNNGCVGSDYFSNGKINEIRKSNGILGENKIMTEYALEFIQELTILGVPLTQINLYLSSIDENNRYSNLQKIEI